MGPGIVQPGIVHFGALGVWHSIPMMHRYVSIDTTNTDVVLHTKNTLGRNINAWLNVTIYF